VTQAKRQSVSIHRCGFTLVELLVTMSIFVILMTLTVAGFRASVSADRDVNAISTFRNALEGARSRAIKSGEIRGLRLVTDANNPLVATSLVYVGSAGTEEGTVQIPNPNDTSFPIVDRIPFGYFTGEIDTNGNGIWDPDDDADGDGLNDRAGWYFGDKDHRDVFANLYERGFLAPGNRISFATATGAEYSAKYTIRSIEYDANDNGSLDASEDFNNNGVFDIQLVEFVRPHQYGNASNGNYYDDFYQSIIPFPTTSGTTNTLYYRLELSPTILPGAELIVMPAGYGIDLDGSKVPAGWRYVEDANGNGQIDGSETDTNGTGMFEFASGYAPNMDLLFTPDGTMVGSLASEGVLHFVVAALSDISLFQTNTAVGRTRSLSGSFPVGGLSTYPAVWLQTDTEHDRKVLSLFTQSGGIVVSDLYNPNGNTDGILNDEYFGNSPSPFLNSLLGLEAKR
jgi:prepilin-type N-terminal cleavage/methylation domain-containing protein